MCRLIALVGIKKEKQQQVDLTCNDENSVSYVKGQEKITEEINSAIESLEKEINTKLEDISTAVDDAIEAKDKIDEFSTITFPNFEEDVHNRINLLSIAKELSGTNTIQVNHVFEQKFLGTKNTDSGYLNISIPEKLKTSEVIKLHYYYDILVAGLDRTGIIFEGITIGKEYYTIDYIDEPNGHLVTNAKEFEFMDPSISNYTAEADVLLSYRNGAFDARVRLIIRPITKTESEE